MGTKSSESSAIGNVLSWEATGIPLDLSPQFPRRTAITASINKEEKMENYPTCQNEASRRFERRPLVKPIEYIMSIRACSDKEMLSLRGKTVDISEAGLGIETDYPLAPGHTLWVNGGIDKAGTVKWSVKTDTVYRAGIKFEAGGVCEKPVVADRHDLFISEEKDGYYRRLNEATAAFIGRLEAIEKKCADPREEPVRLKAAVSEAISEMMSACEDFERSASPGAKALKDAQIRFREKTHPVISKSYIMNRTRVWPQGSQGDYKTLELAYKNTPLSEGIGYYLDLFMLNLPLAHAVRNRMKKLEGILKEEITKRKQPAFLNIACGSSRELMGLVPEIEASDARITCIDTDNDALAFAQSRLSYAGVSGQIEFRKYNALRLFDYDIALSDFGKQDVIYSIGLFDYLPSDFLVKMFGTLYHLLNEGGTLVLSFKDAARYSHQVFHWLVDWDGFQQRREEDFLKIMEEAGILKSMTAEIREDTGIIVFYLVSKKSA